MFQGKCHAHHHHVAGLVGVTAKIEVNAGFQTIFFRKLQICNTRKGLMAAFCDFCSVAGMPMPGAAVWRRINFALPGN